MNINQPGDASGTRTGSKLGLQELQSWEMTKYAILIQRKITIYSSSAEVMKGQGSQ